MTLDDLSTEVPNPDEQGPGWWSGPSDAPVWPATVDTVAMTTETTTTTGDDMTTTTTDSTGLYALDGSGNWHRYHPTATERTEMGLDSDALITVQWGDDAPTGLPTEWAIPPMASLGEVLAAWHGPALPSEVDVAPYGTDRPSGGYVPAQVFADLTARAELLEAEVKAAHARASELDRAATATRRAHESDVAAIGARLIKEANAREWCSDYDDIVASLNCDLYVSLPVRVRRFAVSVSVTFEVEAEHRDEAWEHAHDAMRTAVSRAGVDIEYSVDDVEEQDAD